MEYQPGKPSELQLISQPERVLFLASGAVLIALGLTGRGAARAAIPAGLYIALRGALGSSPLHKLTGMSTAVKTNPQQVSVPQQQGIHVSDAITIENTSPSHIYALLKNPETLEQIVSHIETVNVGDPKRGEWIISLPGGAHLTLSVELINDKHGEVIAWRSAQDSPIAHAGSIRLATAQSGGTEVRVEMEYVPPAGVVGVGIAKLLGVEPKTIVAEAMRNLKQLIEVGEVTPIEGQSRGRTKKSRESEARERLSDTDSEQ